MSIGAARRKQNAILCDLARAQGWRVEHGENHCMLYPPDPTLSPVCLDSTGSDYRAYANTLSRLRQRGLKT